MSVEEHEGGERGVGGWCSQGGELGLVVEGMWGGVGLGRGGGFAGVGEGTAVREEPDPAGSVPYGAHPGGSTGGQKHSEGSAFRLGGGGEEE